MRGQPHAGADLPGLPGRHLQRRLPVLGDFKDTAFTSLRIILIFFDNFVV